jgi:PBSX family phage terminase large subunit
MAGKTFNIEAPRKFLPKQLEVLNACHTHFCILYSGAFRAGKTLLLVNAAIITCLSHAGVEGLIASQTHTTLKSVVFTLFRKELDAYQKTLNDNGIELKLVKSVITSQGNMEIVFYNDSRIVFRACDEERKLAGYTLDFFGIDEPVDVDETIFTQLIGRTSGTGNLKNPFGLLTTNPGSELHWIYKYFYLKKESDYLHVDTTTYDNRLLPNYSKYIKRMEEGWDRDWIRRYLNGQWGMFEGQIYKDFNPAKMKGDFKDLPVDYHIAGVDWGLSSPHCVLDVGVTKDKRLIVLREHYDKKMTTAELSKLIQQWHKEVNFRKVYCDPSANDLIQQTYEKGVPIAYSTKDKLHSYAESGAGSVDNGIARVKSLLRKNLILYDISCTHYEQEMQAYRYKEGTEKPIKEQDHACDTIRYATTDFNPDAKSIGFITVDGWRRFVRTRKRF